MPSDIKRDVQGIKEELLKAFREYVRKEVKTQLDEIKKKYKNELFQMSFL